jgi:hypothetical protein
MKARTGRCRGTRSRAILVFLAISIASAAAADYGSFVAASDRRDDGLILEILKDADLQTSVQICQAIGSRSDPYAADILSSLLAGFSKTGEYKTEYLLRVAMSSLFDPSHGDQELRARFEANAAVLEEMVTNIGGFQDPQLMGILVGLLPRLASANRLRALMDVGARIIDHLGKTDGALSAPDRGLAFDYLSAVQEIGNADFLEPCLAIARLSRDRVLVQKSRQVSKLLADRSR